MLGGNVLSSSTLFHFTNTAEKLLGILENEFYPRYCLEEWTVVKLGTTEPHEIAIPMVCFCDLPLSKISEHLQFYGSYGIGLSKQWGVIKGINPVLYLNKGTFINDHLDTIRNNMVLFCGDLMFSSGSLLEVATDLFLGLFKNLGNNPV